MIDKEVYNLSDRSVKQELYRLIGAAQGFHEVTMKPKRETRRVRANNYYFGLIVTPTMKRINEHGNNFTKKEVHEWIKSKVLAKDLVDKDGVVIGSVGDSSHDKDIPSFHAFVEKAKELVWDTFRVDAPDSDEYFADTAPTAKAGRAA